MKDIWDDGVPPEELTNRDIRQYARRRYWGNWLLWMVCQMPAALLYAAAMAARILLYGRWYALLSAYLICVFAFPITVVGTTALARSVLRCEPPRMRLLFGCVCNWGRLCRAWRMGALYSVLPVLGYDLFVRMPYLTERQASGASVLVLVCVALYVLTAIRGALLPLQLAEGMSGGLAASMRYSFLRMRGQCMRYFGLRLSMRWWMHALLIVFWQLLMQLNLLDGIAEPRRGMLQLAIVLCVGNLIVSPFLKLACTGFLVRLLPNSMPEAAFRHDVGAAERG